MIRVDYTGRTFGELTVIGIAADVPGKPKKWLCQCSCGNIAIVQSNNLKTGQTKSCGCLKPQPTILDGRKFGRLTVVSRCENSEDGTTRQLCKCDCGKYIKVRSRALLSGNTKSCGCLLSDASRERASVIKNPLSNTRIHHIYIQMKQRCFNKNIKAYKDYGGRGITVCKEWLGDDGFQKFYDWSMKNGYSDKLTIDRKDNDGNYSPDNCRWTDYTTQAHNQRIRKNNRSGYKGVSYDKQRHKWRAYLYHKNKLIGMEFFDEKSDAVAYRRKLEEKFGIC